MYESELWDRAVLPAPLKMGLDESTFSVGNGVADMQIDPGVGDVVGGGRALREAKTSLHLQYLQAQKRIDLVFTKVQQIHNASRFLPGQSTEQRRTMLN